MKESNIKEVTCRSYDELNACLERLQRSGWQRDGTIWWHGGGWCNFRCQKMDSTNKPTKGIYAN